MLSFINIDKLKSDLRGVFHHSVSYRSSLTIDEIDDDTILKFAAISVIDFQNVPIAVSLNGPRYTFGHIEIGGRLGTLKVIPPGNLYLASNLKDAFIKLVRERSEEAHAIIEQLPNDFSMLFRALIREVAIFSWPGIDSGSQPSMIGLIYLMPKPDWSAKDYVSALFRETISNVLNLRDMVRCLTPSPNLLEIPENLSLSTMPKPLQPFDKALQSVCRTAGMLWLNQHLIRLGYGPVVDDAFEEINKGRRAVGDLQRIARRNDAMNQQIISAEGWLILDELEVFFNEPCDYACGQLADATSGYSIY